jgi:hypothetical protein
LLGDEARRNVFVRPLPARGPVIFFEAGGEFFTRCFYIEAALVRADDNPAGIVGAFQYEPVREGGEINFIKGIISPPP